MNHLNQFGRCLKSALFCVSVLVFLFCAKNTLAEQSGSCGEHLTWALSDDGVLVISGTGEMTSTPWTGSKLKIAEVIIEEGVTSLRDSAFSGCENLTGVTLPSTLMVIEDRAFYNCCKLEGLELPPRLKTIPNGLCYGCSSLKKVNIRDISIFGQESNPTTWKLAKMNLAIRGLEANLGQHNADTFVL